METVEQLQLFLIQHGNLTMSNKTLFSLFSHDSSRPRLPIERVLGH